MKRFSTLFAGIATSVAGVAIALMPSAANAAPVATPSDAAAFTGNALITGGDVTPPHCGTAVCWSGGTGTFTFGSSACEYVSEYEPGDPVLPAEAGGCSITVTDGTFVNTVCGTGSAAGTANVTATSGADVGETSTQSFSINFKATIGVVTSTGTESDSGTDTDIGVVQIGSTSVSPPSLPLTAAPCTSKFSVTGVDIILDDAGQS